MTKWRREAPAIFWALLAVPCFSASIAAAQGADPGLVGHVPELLAVVGTGLTCFGIATHTADKNLAEMRRDREKDIKAAVADHDGDEDAHVSAGVKNHRPLEQTLSGLSLRVHDIEGATERIAGSLERIERTQAENRERIEENQEAIKEQLQALLDEHREITGRQRRCAPPGPNYTGPLRRRDDPKGRG